MIGSAATQPMTFTGVAMMSASDSDSPSLGQTGAWKRRVAAATLVVCALVVCAGGGNAALRGSRSAHTVQTRHVNTVMLAALDQIAGKATDVATDVATEVTDSATDETSIAAKGLQAAFRADVANSADAEATASDVAEKATDKASDAAAKAAADAVDKSEDAAEDAVKEEEANLGRFGVLQGETGITSGSSLAKEEEAGAEAVKTKTKETVKETLSGAGKNAAGAVKDVVGAAKDVADKTTGEATRAVDEAVDATKGLNASSTIAETLKKGEKALSNSTKDVVEDTVNAVGGDDAKKAVDAISQVANVSIDAAAGAATGLKTKTTLPLKIPSPEELMNQTKAVTNCHSEWIKCSQACTQGWNHSIHADQLKEGQESVACGENCHSSRSDCLKPFHHKH